MRIAQIADTRVQAESLKTITVKGPNAERVLYYRDESSDAVQSSGFTSDGNALGR
jgi:hypothetical protein